MKSIQSLRIPKTAALAVAALTAMVAIPAAAQDHIDTPEAQYEDPYPARPSADHVWEEGCVRPDGDVIEGFWRQEQEEGFFWQDAGYAEDGAWVDYDFVPEEVAPDGYSWEPGCRGNDGVWQLGFWRAAEREGFRWSSGSYEDGGYVSPQWDPREEPRADARQRTAEQYTYEPGYRAETGYWIPGFRRRHARPGYAWAAPYWNGHTYISGFWRPHRVRTGMVWVRGHVGPYGYWVDGCWRPTIRTGYAWTAGYYVAGTYVWGFWRPTIRRAGHVWVAGYGWGGMWSPGHWRVSARVGHFWMPGYYGHGRYVAGYWGVGSAPSYGHAHYSLYSMHVHRSHYHGYHVAHSRPHHGPHYQMSASRVWHRSAVHHVRYAAQQRPHNAGPAPYRQRRQAAAPATPRLPIRSTNAGHVRSVRYDVTRRPSRGPAANHARPTRNPAFRGSERNPQAATRRGALATLPSRPSRPQATRPSRPSRPQATPPSRPSRPQATRPSQPSRPQATRPSQPSRPQATRPRRPSQR